MAHIDCIVLHEGKFTRTVRVPLLGYSRGLDILGQAFEPDFLAIRGGNAYVAEICFCVVDPKADVVGRGALEFGRADELAVPPGAYRVAAAQKFELVPALAFVNLTCCGLLADQRGHHLHFAHLAAEAGHLLLLEGGNREVGLLRAGVELLHRLCEFGVFPHSLGLGRGEAP